jgi:hypothetical protein
MSRRTLLILCVATLALAQSLFAKPLEVPQWQTCDLSFKSTTTHTNPFMVDFSAEVTGPNGVQFSQPGFYDGDQTWKIRLGPNLMGKWKVRTVSSDPQLNDKESGEIDCTMQTNSSLHGGLLVDPDHPHHFVREDGSRFFYSGFECDWLWAVDLNTCDPSLPQTSILLDKLAKYRFNVVYVNIYAHTGFGRPDQKPNFGPPPKYAWAGTNDKADYSTLNLSFWQHYDRVIRALWERGIEAHIMIKVYNKNVKWPAIGSPEDDLYFKTVVARYAPFCNVHWDFSKESNNEKNLDYKLDRMALIRRNDPYRRLLTTHTDRKDYTNYFGVLDYRTDQNHTNYYKTAFRQRSRESWPVVNSEYGYEQGPLGSEDKTYSGADDALTIFKRAWEVYMAGAYGAYYYTYTSWDVVRVNDTPTGYGYYRNLADFFDGVGLWLMKPDDSLVDSGHCLANSGVEYVVYQAESKEFSLKISNARSELKSEWFNPVTGKSIQAPPVKDGLLKLTPPPAWTNGPVVLHIGTAPAEKPVFRNTFDRPLPTKGSR